MPNVEHGCDFALDVTSSGGTVDLSGELSRSWVMSASFMMARGVAGSAPCQIVGVRSTNVTNGRSVERQEGKSTSPMGKRSGQ